MTVAIQRNCGSNNKRISPSSLYIPEVCWVEIAVEETGIVPGWGGEGSEEAENHHHKHLSVGHVEEED